jgi:hypothetical protein
MTRNFVLAGNSRLANAQLTTVSRFGIAGSEQIARKLSPLASRTQIAFANAGSNSDGLPTFLWQFGHGDS